METKDVYTCFTNMGVVIDITGRLALARRLRAVLRHVQLNAMDANRQFLKAICAERDLQESLLLDPRTSPGRVKEAVDTIALLTELEFERRKTLHEIELELNGCR